MVFGSAILSFEKILTKKNFSQIFQFFSFYPFRARISKNTVINILLFVLQNMHTKFQENLIKKYVLLLIPLTISTPIRE